MLPVALVVVALLAGIWLGGRHPGWLPDPVRSSVATALPAFLPAFALEGVSADPLRRSRRRVALPTRSRR